MAKIQTTTIIDDIDGTPTPDGRTITFSIEGKAYEIDLGPLNQEVLFGLFAPYIEKARPVAVVGAARKAKVGAGGGTGDADLIRRWAMRSGIEVAARGRISAELRQRYLEAVDA